MISSIDKQVARQTFQMWLKWFIGDPIIECPVSDITSSMCAIALYTGMSFKDHYNVTAEFNKRVESMIDMSKE